MIHTEILLLLKRNEKFSEKAIRHTVNVASTALRGTKRIDVYENARVDPNIPIEQSISLLKKLVKEGMFDHVAMSECNARTLRRANAVHPITHVETEVSPFCYGEETRQGNFLCFIPELATLTQ